MDELKNTGILQTLEARVAKTQFEVNIFTNVTREDEGDETMLLLLL